MLIILPLFLGFVFLIMETGHLAFQTLILHHAAFEVARIGSLSAAPRPNEGFAPNLGRARYLMDSTLSRIFPKHNASLTTRVEDTLRDPQSGLSNHDLVVDIEYQCPLVFPMTGVILADPARGPIRKGVTTKSRTLYAEVRMPIQQPAFK